LKIRVTDTLGSILAEAAAALSKAGFDEPRRRARRLIASLFTLSPTELLSHPEHGLQRPAVERVRGSLARMVEGEPLSRILGWREFWGLRFALSADTLDPRPESETLVEAVLRRITDRRAPLSFLDLGTGTGCLLLALLSEYPAAMGIGVDLATGAITTARSNAVALGLAERVRFVVCDWVSALSGRFAAIVANPPYITRTALADLPCEVGRHDPRRALDGGEDGLAAYRMIAPELPTLLAPGGVCAVEVGAGQAHAAAAIFAARGLIIDGIERDLADVERCVVMRLAQGPREGHARDSKKKLGMCDRPV
jgi:release factor glutamine methyltransferase